MELLIVCAILGILLAGTVPLFRGSFQGASLRRATGDLAGTLRHAHCSAVAQERAYQVGFDRTGGTYWTLSFSTPKEMADVAGAAGSDATIFKRLLPKDVVISGATYSTNDQFAVTFYPDGTADDGNIQLAVSGAEQNSAMAATPATTTERTAQPAAGAGQDAATIRIRGNDGSVSVEGVR